MAALEDSFLRDLEDLSDDSEGEEEDRDAALPENDEVRTNINDVQESCCHCRQSSLTSRRYITFMQMETEEVDIGNFDTLESRARLQSSERYRTIMEVPFLPALQAPPTPIDPILSRCSAQALECHSACEDGDIRATCKEPDRSRASCAEGAPGTGKRRGDGGGAQLGRTL